MSSTDTQQVTMPDILKTEAIPEDPNKQTMSELPKNDNKPVLLTKDKKTELLIKDKKTGLLIKKKKKKPEIPRKKKKKPDDPSKPVPLNLNNEVVRMRKEVKRVRALVIRKLTRQMASLKKRKGKEEDLERNRRRVGRLLEEIHEMKTLKPDPVTKAALQKNLSFEFVCKNPKATISDRAVARIATHPQFSKKIDTIKAAIKAFKDERMIVEKGDEKGAVKKQPLKVVEVIEQPKDSDGEGGVEGEEGKDEEEDGTPVESQSLTVDEPAVIEKQPVDKTVRVTEEDISTIENKESAIENTLADPQPKEMSEADKTLVDSSTPFTIEAPQVVPTKNIVTMKNTPQKQVVQKLTKDTPATQKTQDPKPQKVTKPQIKDVKNKQDDEEEDSDDDEEEESDLESSDDEEKEYFDDSTEERFRKQSSQSDESDNDDFFLGKVAKFKKKSDAATAPPGGGEGKSSELGKNPLLEPLESLNPHQTELDELEARQNFRGRSVFCSSLSGSRGGRGGGRGRGGGGGRGMGRGGGRGGDFKNRGRGGDDGPSRGPGSHDRGSGRGRGDFGRQREGRGFSSTSSSQPPQQALHPSWEASKKRKEQQTVVVAFQGKKIKFDD